MSDELPPDLTSNEDENTPPKKIRVEDLTRDEAVIKLWNNNLVAWKFNDSQLNIYEKLVRTQSKIFVINAGRQLGKTRAKTATCMTPSGPVQMQYIKPGDKVYGYNSDGSISLCNVIDSWSEGKKKVVDLTHNGIVLETCTKDHKWLTKARQGTVNDHLPDKVRRTGDFYKGTIIRRELINIPCGIVNEPHAYAIGALLGDGCSRQGLNKINISSEDAIIPNKVANILGCEFVYKNSNLNYTWVLSNEVKKTVGASSAANVKAECNYYDQWCRGKYAHEKTADWNIINTWDRKTCLNFIAGLIDTDGSVGVRNNILVIQLTMQAKPVIEAVQKLIFKLWQHKSNIVLDKRTKYKNGPVHLIKISNNLFSKRALKELDSYLVCPRKKWKLEYENCLENNSNLNYIGVKQSEEYETECWEISVDSDTHMYLTGNGMVTHNSFMLCGYAIEFALQHPGAKILYLAPTAKMVKKIILPRMTEILKDCPRELKPKYKVNEQVYQFSNGAEISISGTDSERAEGLRGQIFHLVICDEAGFMDKLDNVVSSILIPCTTHTRGRIILSSTPPTTNDHPFKDFADRADLENAYVKKTIFDNTMLTKEDIAVLMRESGGKNSVAWRREYLAEFIVDSNEAVIPEATQEKLALITKQVVHLDKDESAQEGQIAIPLFFDAYTVADLGYTDNTGILYGYWDFINAKLVIQDESLFNKPNTKIIAEIVKAKEKELWGEQKPYLRFCDGDLIAISDLNNVHNLSFSSTKNDELESSVNACRLFIDGLKIVIDPKCRYLLSQIHNATWDATRKKFKRSQSHGHYDLLAALIYMIRNVQRHRNPFPSDMGMDIATMFIPRQEVAKDASQKAMVKALDLTSKYFKKD